MSNKKRIPKTHSLVPGQPPEHFIKIWTFLSKYYSDNEVSPSLSKYVKSKLASSTSVIRYYLNYMVEANMVKRVGVQNNRTFIPLPREKWGTWNNPITGGRAHASRTKQ